MGVNPIKSNFPKSLHGKVTERRNFRFDCGFEIPLTQIEGLIDERLKPDDQVILKIDTVYVERSHKHNYRCTTCGGKYVGCERE
jgi:hypothetical protein